MSSRWIALASAAVLAAPLAAHAAAPPDLAGSSELLGIAAGQARLGGAPLLSAIGSDAAQPDAGTTPPSPFDGAFLGEPARESPPSATTYSYLAERRHGIVDLGQLLGGRDPLDGAPLPGAGESSTGTSYTVVERGASAHPSTRLPATLAVVASALGGIAALAWRRQQRGAPDEQPSG